MIKTPIEVTSGIWTGFLIRRARKSGQCQFYRGKLHGGMCQEVIQAGDLYLAGEGNYDAGGYGQDRYCKKCAADEINSVTKE